MTSKEYNKLLFQWGSPLPTREDIMRPDKEYVWADDLRADYGNVDWRKVEGLVRKLWEVLYPLPIEEDLKNGGNRKGRSRGEDGGVGALRQDVGDEGVPGLVGDPEGRVKSS